MEIPDPGRYGYGGSDYGGEAAQSIQNRGLTAAVGTVDADEREYTLPVRRVLKQGALMLINRGRKKIQESLLLKHLKILKTELD